ncbi:MAG: hypothetical protein M1822_009912 [Bathelium mastoideum]|nr:MAG: hypothetical protein M1822_009912 [Bathelium mastoideum]
MASIQLNFTLRTSSNCKTVHLLGSWDGYKGQLPLSKDSAKAGAWKGTFRFQGRTLQPGQRHWYYYIIDGYHVSHDPAREHTTEPTTGRKLNILDIPAGKSTTSSGHRTETHAPSSKRHARIASTDIPKGRALSPSQIQSPKPINPSRARAFANADYSSDPSVVALSSKFRTTTITPYSATPSSTSSDSYGYGSEIDSDSGRSSNSSRSSVPSLRSSGSTSPSSAGSCCTCERYGITRSGDRVKLDCGGSRCGYSEESSECSSDTESSDDEQVHYQARTTRRQGVVVRR